MTTLRDILDRTMMFTAAKIGGSPIPFTGKFKCPKPDPITEGLDEDTVMRNPIWHFKYDPEEPGVFRDLTILSRGMGMNYSMPVKAFTKIEFSNVMVEQKDGTSFELPLKPEFLVQTWWGRGRIEPNNTNLWQLEARLDPSVVAVFAYEIDCGAVTPLSLEAIEALGDAFMPQMMLPPALSWLAGEAPAAWVCIGPTRYCVVVELCPNKEWKDFVPGEITGFARIHPHAYIISNDDDVKHAEVSIGMHRPAMAMTHGDDSMMNEHTALVVTDTNVPHVPLLPVGLPIPYTDVLYDYYETDAYNAFKNRTPKEGEHPLQQKGEVTLVDPRFQDYRTIKGVIQRNSPITLLRQSDVEKVPRQGMFDNVHLAPRMRWRAFKKTFTGGEEVVFDHITMLNMCLHDCCHMHVRWPEFFTNHAEQKMTWGWHAGKPFAKAGAPAVPENQTVFCSFPNKHSLVYRAVAHNPKEGELQVFCHHGLAYAVDRWPGAMAFTKQKMLLTTIREMAVRFGELYAYEAGELGDTPMTWQEFYWRIRWTVNRQLGGEDLPLLRSVFKLEDCLK